MVEVGRFDTRTDAEFARSLLAAAEIPCVLAPDEAAGAYPIDLSAARVSWSPMRTPMMRR